MAADDYWAVCERVTGKDRDEWTEEFKRRRRIAVQRKVVSETRPMSHHEVETAIRRYGFKPDDFYAVLIRRGNIGEMTKETGVDPKGNVQDVTHVLRFKLKPGIVP